MRNFGRWAGWTAMVFFLWVSTALPQNLRLPVIVDTDAAADDIRAITILLNSGGSDIRLIVTSDGVLSPETGAVFCRNLLTCMNRPDTPVVAGKPSAAPLPQFRNLNEMLAWPPCESNEKADIDSSRSAVDAIISAIKDSQDNVLYLCFGPMTTLAEAICRDPSIVSRLYRIVYSGSFPGSENQGWNTRRDPFSAKSVYEAGVPVYGLGLPEDRFLPLEAVFDDIRGIGSNAAWILIQTHDVKEIKKRVINRHMKIWDEMVAIYITLISGFDFTPVSAYPHAMQLVAFDRETVQGAYVRLLKNPIDF